MSVYVGKSCICKDFRSHMLVLKPFISKNCRSQAAFYVHTPETVIIKLRQLIITFPQLLSLLKGKSSDLIHQKLRILKEYRKPGYLIGICIHVHFFRRRYDNLHFTILPASAPDYLQPSLFQRPSRSRLPHQLNMWYGPHP